MNATMDEIARTTMATRRTVRQVAQAAQERCDPSWAHIDIMQATMLR
jgi:predicted transcriptional regulator